MQRRFFQILILLSVVVASCDPPPIILNPPPPTSGAKTWVVCEGSLGNGNGSLTLFRPDADSIYQEVFAAVNGVSLGDVFQSMTRIGEQYFLCINNSDKIVVINRKDYRLEGMISVSKPRYVLPVNASKAYVTSLFSKQLFIINPQTLQQTGVIDLPFQNGEGMLLKNEKAYICAWDTSSNAVFVVNTTNDKIEDTFFTAGRAPQEILEDKNGMLWVLSGNVAKGKTAALSQINPATGALLKSFSFPPTADPLRLEMNPSKDTLYFIEVNYTGGTANNGIYRMNIADAALPTASFIAAQALQYFWALGIEPATGKVYIGDPKGFIQQGSVQIYDPQGKLLKTFQTGVGPGHFYFD